MNERSQLLDDAVLAAAAKVIAEHGWHEFTLERVAQAAGISRVTLYRKGATRELLVEALVVGAAQAWQAGLWLALTGPGNAAERLRAALRASCEVVEQHLSLLAGLSNAPDPVFHLDGGDTRNVYVAPFERLLHDGIADGSLRATLDPATTALLLFNIVPRTYIHLRDAHQWLPDRTAEALLDLLMPGVLPEHP